MYVYETQCVNFVNFSIYNDIDVVFFVIDLIVDIIKNTVDDSIKIKIITHCDYFLCDKNDYWFKNCKLKHSKKQKTFDERNKIQKKNVETIKRKIEKTKKSKTKTKIKKSTKIN